MTTQEPGSRTEWKILTLHKQAKAASEVAAALMKGGFTEEAIQGAIYAATLEAVALLWETPTDEQFDTVGYGFLESFDHYLASVQSKVKERM